MAKQPESKNRSPWPWTLPRGVELSAVTSTNTGTTRSGPTGHQTEREMPIAWNIVPEVSVHFSA
ncbi:Uu.00g071740.m01.CDS01 [Anthostomella pinea]|uniref:Uu.00g071740.m01.CDS01 n=1 Tax=Anthostomella pinea TaxID=933095 RepID=A0AAI8VVQ6_9PEZI|nr:Uu.00g071740.m01.CDS01 [Anthostomella pinea]